MKRIFYVSAGGADLIQSHEYWKQGANNPAEVSLTFSGQIESFVEGIDAQALMISNKADGRRMEDGRFTIEHWPKASGHGIGYYLGELRNAVKMVRAAKAFRADLALLDSGAMPLFMMGLFRLAGIPVLPILHNTLWAHGFRPTGRARRMVERLDACFMRRGPVAVIAVSPEAARQVGELTGGVRYPVREIRAQFDPGYFRTIPPAPPWDAPTFNMMFIGRVNREKGVLGIPEMARIVETRLPGRVRWTICGRGPHLEELRTLVADGLGHVVDVRGWTSLEDLQRIYAETHACIVPTRSLFEEGLAMTAVEAILAGRPVVTNPVVPAHEVLAPAVVLGRTNDPASHAKAVIRIAGDRALYGRLRDACADLRAPFYDRRQGLTAVLREIVDAHG